MTINLLRFMINLYNDNNFVVDKHLDYSIVIKVNLIELN